MRCMQAIAAAAPVKPPPITQNEMSSFGIIVVTSYRKDGHPNGAAVSVGSPRDKEAALEQELGYQSI